MCEVRNLGQFVTSGWRRCVSWIPRDSRPWEPTPSFQTPVCASRWETPIGEFLDRPVWTKTALRYSNVVFHWLRRTLTSSRRAQPGIHANLERKTNWAPASRCNGSLGKLRFPGLTGTVKLKRPGETMTESVDANLNRTKKTNLPPRTWQSANNHCTTTLM